MGIAMSGVTNCENCMKPLKYDEYVLCKKCEEKKKKKRTKIETCDYCHGQKYLSNALFSSVKIQQFEDKNKKRIYTLTINNSTYIKINYCPICGKKLKEN